MSSSPAWKPSHNSWLIAVIVTLGAFMEVLDTTIVNVALPHIAGTLSVSSDDATWTLTSYLVANGVVLTISGWLATVLGRKRYFLICIAMFTICSLLCGLAQSLPQLIMFRLAQGFFGGGLQPTQQAIILDTFEPSQRGKAFAVTAIATVVAPVMGPTFGGWLTDTYSWRWVFLINIPIGLFTFFAVMQVVEDPPWARRRKVGTDYVGLSLITIGLGALQVMMDRGEDEDWFGSNNIIILGCVAVIGILGAIAWLLYTDKPVVNIRVLANRNFALGSICVSIMAGVLYASAVIIPQLAQQVLGYNATWAGFILSPGGVVIILLIPIVGRLMSFLPAKYFVFVGFCIMGAALLYSHNLVPYVDFRTLAMMRASQTMGLAFLFVPISTLAYATLPKEMNGDASALFTMFRNVWGSIAISLSTAMITEQTQTRTAYLVRHLTPLDMGYVSDLQRVEGGMLAIGQAQVDVHQRAVNWVYQQLHTQASILAYSDAFALIAILAFCAAPVALFFSSPKKGGKPGDAPPMH